MASPFFLSIFIQEIISWPWISLKKLNIYYDYSQVLVNWNRNKIILVLKTILESKISLLACVTNTESNIRDASYNLSTDTEIVHTKTT